MSMLKYAISVMVATAVVHGVGCDSNNGRMGSSRLVGSGASSLFSYFVFLLLCCSVWWLLWHKDWEC